MPGTSDEQTDQQTKGPAGPNAAELADDLRAAWSLLPQLAELPRMGERYPSGPNAVYTTPVVLWMLVWHRMSPDSTLEAALKNLIATRPSLLPDNRRVRERTLSTATGGYSSARGRMPLEAAEEFADLVAESIVRQTEPTWNGRRVFLVDGTTVTLTPEPGLLEAFPPGANQHGPTVWPVALMAVCHELASGAALRPRIGPMYGPEAVSETRLIRGCLDELPADSVVMADAGYGIFAVAWAGHSAGHQFFLRLSGQRMESLRKKAELTASGATRRGEHWSTYELEWRPSRWDDSSDLPEGCSLSVRLLQWQTAEGEAMSFVTDLEGPAEELAELYRRRNDVEVDIRHLKVVLNGEEVRSRSRDTVLKELMGSAVAYNLVVQFRRQAAARAGQLQGTDVPPRRMSFSKIWRTFRIKLLGAVFSGAGAPADAHDLAPANAHDLDTAAEAITAYESAMAWAVKDTLPDRRGRSFQREAYRKQSKSQRFPQRPRRSPPAK